MEKEIDAIKHEFCRFCHLIYQRQLVSGVGGNISSRVNKKILVTPSGLSLRDMAPEMVVIMDEKGRILDGARPTKDVGLHRGILREREDISVVFHTHGVYLTAASAMLPPGPHSIPPLTPGFVYYAYPLPLLPFMVPGTENFTKETIRMFSKKKTRAVLFQNHGLVNVGKDFSEALNIAEEINEAAKIFVLTNGKASVIPSDDLDKISGTDH
jgi:ribulose-5-phosphate 4-epimerase/fuculose-1-phosphate aldolase